MVSSEVVVTMHSVPRHAPCQKQVPSDKTTAYRGVVNGCDGHARDECRATTPADSHSVSCECRASTPAPVVSVYYTAGRSEDARREAAGRAVRSRVVGGTWRARRWVIRRTHWRAGEWWVPVGRCNQRRGMRGPHTRPPFRGVARREEPVFIADIKGCRACLVDMSAVNIYGRVSVCSFVPLPLYPYVRTSLSVSVPASRSFIGPSVRSYVRVCLTVSSSIPNVNPPFRTTVCPSAFSNAVRPSVRLIVLPYVRLCVPSVRPSVHPLYVRLPVRNISLRLC